MANVASGDRLQKASVSLTQQDVKRILRNFNIFGKVKAEIDQFLEGLLCLEVMDVVRKHPMLMQPLHIPSESCQLTKGMYLKAVVL